MYRVISCGVNEHPLRFAEKDAEDVARFFQGSLGPPVDQVVPLIGAAASAQNIEFEIVRAGLQRPAPSFLVLYFSGHGTPQGIVTSTGILDYEKIIQALRLASIPFATVILDVCFAASYLGFLKEAVLGSLGVPPDLRLRWLLALSAATEGTRLIFSTGRDRLAGESSKLENGFFTYAFLQALRRSRGDMWIADRAWISDQRAFAVARRILLEITGGEQEPVERGLTGDFPLALCQADEPVGRGHFIRTAIESGTLGVRFEIDERKHIETRVRWKLLNGNGNEIATSLDTLHPSDEHQVYRGRIECPHDRVREDLVARLQRITENRATLEWVLTLEDEHGHVLDEKIVPAFYRW